MKSGCMARMALKTPLCHKANYVTWWDSVALIHLLMETGICASFGNVDFFSCTYFVVMESFDL